MERLGTGVENLDVRIEGGFYKGSVNLITGKTGTGKTAFSLSYIREGLVNGEAGVYITTEESRQDILKDVKEMFGWDLEKYSDKGLLRIEAMKPVFPTSESKDVSRLIQGYISEFMEELEESVDEVGAERVVIDSLSLIEMFVKDEYTSRVAISSLINKLKELGVTAILVGTVPETSEGLSGGGITEYLVDGVIKLEFRPVAEKYSRTLEIRKMRRTDHAIEIFPIEIADAGLKLMDEGFD